MQPAVSVQDVRGVSPAWLRPSAFVLILCLHWVLLVGIGWPTGTGVAEPPPLEIQVIPRAEPAQLLVPLESASMVEIKPPNAVPVDVQAIEAQPLHGREIAEFKPAAPALATGPPPGVLVSTAPEGATLKSPAAPAPMAPLQVADAALVAASVGASPVPVEPPRLDPLPPSEQQVAELEPLVTRPAAATKSAQPAREASPVVASASGLDPPSKALLPGQPVAESEPMVARPAVRVETAQPVREAFPVVASAAGLDPPSKPLQPLAESEPLMAGPTIAAEIVQDAREPPRAEAPASAIGPPSRPLSPKQQVVEL